MISDRFSIGYYFYTFRISKIEVKDSLLITKYLLNAWSPQVKEVRFIINLKNEILLFFCIGILMKVDYVGASHAIFSYAHPCSVELLFNLWYELLLKS